MQDLIKFIEDMASNNWEANNWELKTGTLRYLNTPGIIQFCPKNNEVQDNLVLSAGIHGNETAPIEILWDIISSIQSEKLNPNINTLFIFGHAKAMLKAKRFIDFNLNRLFSKNHENFPNAQESKRAKEIEMAISTFFHTLNPSQNSHQKNWHLDLHTAIRGSHHERFAVRPFYRDATAVSDDELNLCAALGVQAILKTATPATTFAGFSASKFNAQSFTVELGKVAVFGKNDLNKFKKAKDTLIDILERGSTRFPKQVDQPIVYNVDKELINDHEGYKFYINKDYLNFTPLEEGQKIEHNREGLLIAKQGQSIVFPNPNVPQGQRTGLLVRADFNN